MIKLGDCGTDGRVNVEVTMHEILHALGFYHEHTRRDRNTFISINTDNILPGKYLLVH